MQPLVLVEQYEGHTVIKLLTNNLEDGYETDFVSCKRVLVHLSHFSYMPALLERKDIHPGSYIFGSVLSKVHRERIIMMLHGHLRIGRVRLVHSGFFSWGSPHAYKWGYHLLLVLELGIRGSGTGTGPLSSRNAVECSMITVLRECLLSFNLRYTSVRKTLVSPPWSARNSTPLAILKVSHYHQADGCYRYLLEAPSLPWTVP
jgi:hypothetical protein